MFDIAGGAQNFSAETKHYCAGKVNSSYLLTCRIPFEKAGNLSMFSSGRYHRWRTRGTPLSLVNKTDSYNELLKAYRHDDVATVITESDFQPGDSVF